ncbi:hypothetical protein V1511DRAFT_505923 [Dipodascopsis uninucleata]
MPINAVRRGIAEARNGVGAFVLPCKRLTFRYCNWGASSVGMREYLHEHLKAFSDKNKCIEMVVTKKRGQPVIIGDYMNGRQKVICVGNMRPHEIDEKAKLLSDASGNKLKKVTQPVQSINESPRGIWSPFHELEQFRHRI